MGRRHQFQRPPASEIPSPGGPAVLYPALPRVNGARLYVSPNQLGGTDYNLILVPPGGEPTGTLPVSYRINTPEMAAALATQGIPLPDGWGSFRISIPALAGQFIDLCYTFAYEDEPCQRTK